MKSRHMSADLDSSTGEPSREIRDTEFFKLAKDASQTFVERRQHARLGVVTRLEDITYTVLRGHQLIREAA